MRDFFIALLACISFGIVFEVPKKYLFLSGIGGAIAWISYLITIKFTNSPIIACFVGSISVGLFGELSAIRKKAPAPIFIIPGIITLVPGANMYYAMLYLIKNQVGKASEAGSQAFFLAGSIACGLIVVTSVFKIIKRRTVS